MTKWTLPQGRKPLTDADMADLTRRLAGTAIDYKELYEAALHDAKEAEAYVAELEANLAKAVKSLDGVMIGGNHLAVWLPDDHPTADVEPLAALEQIGAGVTFDVWCCWRSIMQARATLAELKGEKIDQAQERIAPG